MTVPNLYTEKESTELSKVPVNTQSHVNYITVRAPLLWECSVSQLNPLPTLGQTFFLACLLTVRLRLRPLEIGQKGTFIQLHQINEGQFSWKGAGREVITLQQQRQWVGASLETNPQSVPITGAAALSSTASASQAQCLLHHGSEGQRFTSWDHCGS